MIGVHLNKKETLLGESATSRASERMQPLSVSS